MRLSINIMIKQIFAHVKATHKRVDEIDSIGWAQTEDDATEKRRWKGPKLLKAILLPNISQQHVFIDKLRLSHSNQKNANRFIVKVGLVFETPIVLFDHLFDNPCCSDLQFKMGQKKVQYTDEENKKAARHRMKEPRVGKKTAIRIHIEYK
jgi:hypothetical protein